MEFNQDGSLKTTKISIPNHISVLNLIDELDFGVGKKLLIEILKGELNTKIKKHGFQQKIYHGCFARFESDQISLFLDHLSFCDLITTKKEKGVYQIIQLTPKGKTEIQTRELEYNIENLDNDKNKKLFPETKITEQDKKLFKEFDFFLKKFTEQQKKAIISTSPKQLCIAGAGSGKTSVLTHKIAFLVKFLGVKPEEILAITFTRKARQEMIHRLSNSIPHQVRVETFNSFAEKEISYHSLILYGKEKQMVSQKEFLKIVTSSLTELGYTFDRFIEHYFTTREKNGKDQRQLFFSFLYDFNAILDSYIREGKDKEKFSKHTDISNLSDRVTAKSIVNLLQLVTQKLEQKALRTYSDQLLDIIRLYKEHPHLRKKYSWILVDEYQDVNSEQIELINLLSPKNTFVVGDPRQSIFAWRGAEPDKIYEYVDQNTEVIQLTTNFRSTKNIVSFSNNLLGGMGFEECSSYTEEEGAVVITKYGSEDSEAQAIINEILAFEIPRKEIYILSRTNKGLDKIANLCDKNNIQYILRTDEKKQLNVDPSEQQITLSTVHAIKGLEAKVVYVIGANYQNYPCKAKDHRFVELFSSTKEYDQIAEEKRLLYVACTRAKNLLRITHTSSLTPFISKTNLCCKKEECLSMDIANTTKQEKALKKWRYLEAKDRGIEPYSILTNKMLDELLDSQPQTIEELKQIRGFTETRIKEFGYDVISIIKRNF